MSIYNVDFQQQTLLLLPPKKRKQKRLAYLGVVASLMQYYNDLTFIDYADGFTGNKWLASVTYSKGERIRYSDFAVYECILNAPMGTLPTNTTYFVKVLNLFIGSRERAKYNSDKLLFEYLLNKYFDTNFVQPKDGISDIYITNNSLSANIKYWGKVGGGTPIMYIGGSTDGTPLYVGSSTGYAPTYSFTVHFPTAVFSALLPTTTQDKYNFIQSIIDKYKFAGKTNNIVLY